MSKKKRGLGQQYHGRRYNKENKRWEIVQRGERKRGALCTNKCCKDSVTRHCDEFTGDDCNLIFHQFWSGGFKSVQNTFVQSLVDVKGKIQYTTNNNLRRNFSRVFRSKKGVLLQVCKRLLQSTSAISGQRLNSALSVNNGNNVGIARTEIKARNKNPSRGVKWDLGDQDFLEEFFRVVPKAEGHYCRKDSKKI